MNTETDDFVKQFKERFDRSVNDLDGNTASRLSRLRHGAIERIGERKAIAYWIPAGAVATSCVAVLVYGLLPQPSVEEKTFIDEIDIITELDLFENLEFYEWLERHELPS